MLLNHVAAHTEYSDLRVQIPESYKYAVKVMFLAKHALGDGSPDSMDGFHAVYHHELREILRNIGLNLKVGNSYQHLFGEPDYDFLFTLLNRGGFKNSELFAATFATWRDTPFLGASPILRGLGDDKHLTKLVARARGVSTPDSEIYRHGNNMNSEPAFDYTRLVVKPNASSASWGIKICDNWSEAKAHRDWLFEEMNHHDVIIESFFDGIELAVPVIVGADGNPVLLPVMKYGGDNDRLRTYEEKRGFVQNNDGWAPFDDPTICTKLLREVEKMMPEIWPFDYGRFEFKFSPESGETSFLELNMSCNLWSKKTVSQSWQSMGYSHAELVETILAGSMIRQGVIPPQPANK